LVSLLTQMCDLSMTNNPDNVISIWKSSVSDQLDEPDPLELSAEFKTMAAMFSPGHYYYFVLNLYSMEFEYLHPSVETMLGLPSLGLKMKDLVARQHPDDKISINTKEEIYLDFLLNHLQPEHIKSYKALYMLRLRDAEGRYRQILQQSTVLKTNDEGQPEFLMGVHTDVTYFRMPYHKRMSFISLKSSLPSYFNIQSEGKVFEPEKARAKEMSLQSLLSTRELEIIRWLSQGFNAEQIGERLNISYNTIRTHRKNMLAKSGCRNTTELVAQCLLEGLI